MEHKKSTAQLLMKNNAVKQALSFVSSLQEEIIGLGTGSTMDLFIEGLATIKHKIKGVVCSSIRTEQKAKAMGFSIYDLNVVNGLTYYFDGADEINPHFQMIKGGGGALTREKVLAQASRVFVCVVDETKKVTALGRFPIALEVLPLARSLVAREIVKMGMDPAYRQGFVTDNGNIILDLHTDVLSHPIQTEENLKKITGVVESGVFAKRTADIVIIGKEKDAEVLKKAP